MQMPAVVRQARLNEIEKSLAYYRGVAADASARGNAHEAQSYARMAIELEERHRKVLNMSEAAD